MTFPDHYISVSHWGMFPPPQQAIQITVHAQPPVTINDDTYRLVPCDVGLRFERVDAEEPDA